jgi:hypothetical protein
MKGTLKIYRLYKVFIPQRFRYKVETNLMNELFILVFKF